MADVVDPLTRSRMMSGIRGKNTRPEISLRKSLHALGFRFRLHGNMPGKPDLVFPKYHAVIFVHGCFWHMHDCHLFKWPSSRSEFWREKIESNRRRDELTYKQLRDDGWRIFTVWECAIKGRTRRNEHDIAHAVADWLTGETEEGQLRGHDHGVTGRLDRLDG